MESCTFVLVINIGFITLQTLVTYAETVKSKTIRFILKFKRECLLKGAKYK